MDFFSGAHSNERLYSKTKQPHHSENNSPLKLEKQTRPQLFFIRVITLVQSLNLRKNINKICYCMEVCALSYMFSH